MTVDQLTRELGELVADATALPTTIDPVRPPSVPGCFVGPPSLTPDTETGGRVLVAQWEVGAVVAATTGAWEAAAVHAEHIAAAVIAHDVLALVSFQSVLYPTGDGELPGYRVDVAVLLHGAALEELGASPTVDGAAHLTAAAALTADGTVLALVTIDGAVELAAAAALTAAGTVVAAATIDAAATMTAAAALTAAGTVAGPFTPADLPGLVGWWDASDLATITAAGGKVSQWGDKSGHGFNWIQGTAAAQPSTGIATMNGRNVLTLDATDDFMGGLSANPMAGAAAGTSVWVAQNAVGVPVNVWPAPVCGLGAGGDDDWSPFSGGDLYSNFGSTSRHDGVGTGLTAAMQAPYMLTQRAAAGSWANWLNGTALATLGANVVGWAPATNIRLGYTVTGVRNYGGEVAEIILYDSALNPTDRATVESYLRAKWGTP